MKCKTVDLMDNDYDVVIIGAGVIGTALLYVLSNFSNVEKVLMLEKYSLPAQLNSSSRNNSQTLHFGDIETNYGIEKVKETRAAAEMLCRYMDILPPKARGRIMAKCQKMVIGIGVEEAEAIRARYDEEFLRLFPDLQVLDRRAISKVEPNIMKGRHNGEEILGVYAQNGYMVDFGSLSTSFLDGARDGAHRPNAVFDNPVHSISECQGGYEVRASRGTYSARAVVVSAGAHTLSFAKSLGYGDTLSIIPVLGRFYHSKKVLDGKVYTMPRGKIPFLSVHGDPDINHANQTRYGPTITPYPFLERPNLSVAIDNLKSMGLDYDTVMSYSKIMRNGDIRHAILRNLSYSLPLFGKSEFVKNEVNKIVPRLTARDVHEHAGEGGIRPQIVDRKKGEIMLGEGKIKKGGLVFNITPSPGASSCMKIAFDDAVYITNHIGAKFYRERFMHTFHTG